MSEHTKLKNYKIPPSQMVHEYEDFIGLSHWNICSLPLILP